MNIDEMPAGHEMDALVAEWIMGWKFRKPTHGNCCTCQNCGRAHDECGGSCDYSTDISAAWEVVERVRPTHIVSVIMRGDGYQCLMEIRDGKMRFPIDLAHVGDAFGDAEDAPLAICRAALKALERTRDENIAQPR